MRPPARRAPSVALMGPRDRPTRPCPDGPAQPTGRHARVSAATPDWSGGVLGGVLRDALRTFLIVSAAAAVTFPLLPHRPPPPRPAHEPYPLVYVAICCSRPVYIQELKK